MKLFKNKKGFSDVVTVSLLGGIIGSLFITGVFVWKEIDKNIALQDLYYSEVVRVSQVSDILEEVVKNNVSIGCDVQKNQELSKAINQSIIDGDDLSKSNELNNLLSSSCFQKGEYKFYNLLDINADGTEEILIKKTGDSHLNKNGFADISIMKLGHNDIYDFIDFFYHRNLEDKTIRVRDSIVIKLGEKVFNDFNNDGVVDLLESTDNVYVYQDGAFVRVNDTRDRVIDCINEAFPECIWQNVVSTVSPDEKKVAWIFYDVYSEGGVGSIAVYDYSKEKFNDYYAGEVSAYSRIMDYLEWTPEGDGLIFVKKACVIPGCGYSISRLNILNGEVLLYERIADSSFEEDDNVTDEEILEKAKNYVTSIN